MRERALPILESGGVDLVLAGHSHSYERSYLIDGHYDLSPTLADSMIIDDGDGRLDGDGVYTKPSSGTAPHEGAVYVVCGSSGKVDSGTFDHPVMPIYREALGSVVLDIDGNQLDAKFIASDGVVQDYFTLVKGDARVSATEISKISGDEQIGVIGDTLPEPLVVEVRNAQRHAGTRFSGNLFYFFW